MCVDMKEGNQRSRPRPWGDKIPAEVKERLVKDGHHTRRVASTPIPLTLLRHSSLSYRASDCICSRRTCEDLGFQVPADPRREEARRRHEMVTIARENMPACLIQRTHLPFCRSRPCSSSSMRPPHQRSATIRISIKSSSSPPSPPPTNDYQTRDHTHGAHAPLTPARAAAARRAPPPTARTGRPRDSAGPRRLGARPPPPP
jgi:hypothetical protein